MQATETPMLELKDIYKSFGDVEVLKGISAKIDKGELLTFVGPSGCGKTTLLRIVGGFATPTSGQVILDGEDIGKLPPNMRDTKMVFQSYALFPHMNVRKEYRLWAESCKNGPRKRLIHGSKSFSLVHMEGLGERTIDRISGGQQQRVASGQGSGAGTQSAAPGRAAFQPGCQPAGGYAGGDQEISRSGSGSPPYFVTHDQYEAMSISDRLLVLHDGVIQQIGSPIDIYERPANEFIAGFVGYVNFLEGTVDAIDEETNTSYVITEYGKLELDHDQRKK